jgi:hypothetical protein
MGVSGGLTGRGFAPGTGFGGGWGGNYQTRGPGGRGLKDFLQEQIGVSKQTFDYYNPGRKTGVPPVGGFFAKPAKDGTYNPLQAQSALMKISMRPVEMAVRENVTATRQVREAINGLQINLNRTAAAISDTPARAPRRPRTTNNPLACQGALKTGQ